MIVTKQQQLEWLAKECHTWKGRDFILVSDTELGYRLPVTAGCHLITREEWQQERDNMQKQPAKPAQDNSWHERGELPPVGCECEVMHKCWSEFKRVTVAAITKEYAIVDDDSVVAREQHYHIRDITFRPIRTEREMAIDAAFSAVGGVCGYGLLIIERLYDAGMLK